jgi:hypothetical protein
MRTREDIVAYLERSSYPHREIEDGTWLVHDPSGLKENVVVRLTDDLALFRVKVMDVANTDSALYGTLLELNATDMVHGAYGLSDGKVLLVATLRLENLDYNEFVGTLDDFGVALAKHHERLAPFGKPLAKADAKA